ncbi:membrane protein insertion efficiency factor YidD [Auraticoccus sp. F435]|uniref:Membrane protein insertion efficiency factor YidD n=1 Tax=Auraticoccus cholistanensis TaxID=2656650 RepID=A0A6A9V0T5_9ACTN|nr:membrane protein insertion efficiency factor YidD [Auraticoccus cholistanensis]MVA75930.1 membrane protein insertion efficiency factor YidD [Auraticoccus cholistanensis]
MLTSLAIQAIHAYQRHLSPHKGFSCAYAVATDGLSCSAVVLDLVRERGLLGALPRIAGQFASCGRAARVVGSRVSGVCCCGPIPIPFGFGGR